jgi:formate hydrogenlyase subunit 3/multisubunit Na+/H+ antiporter MnhD subunit
VGSPLLERIRLTIGGFILALAIVAGLFMGHHLSAVGFAVSVLLLAVAAGIVLTRFLQRFRHLDALQPPDERTLRRRVRTAKITLAILTVCLFLALWKTGMDRIYSHWFVITFGVLGIIGSIQDLRRGQMNLKQFEDRRTT